MTEVPPPKRSFLFLWVALGLTAVIVSTVALLVFVLLPKVSDSLSSFGPGDPLPVTPESSPVVGCDNCFSREDAGRLIPGPAQLTILGDFGATPGYVAAAPNTIGEWADDAHEQFFLADGDPTACDFLVSGASLSPASPSFYSRDDVVVDLGRFESGSKELTVTARIFWSTIYADRFTSSLTSPLKQCATVRYLVDDAVRDSVVLPLAQSVVAGVAVDSWTEAWGGTIRYVADLQYWNLALRVTLTGDSEDAQRFVAYVEAVSNDLVALESLTLSNADPGADASCTGECFSIDDARTAAVASADLSDFDFTVANGPLGNSLMTGVFSDRAERMFKDGPGFPINCSFLLSDAAVSSTNPGMDPALRLQPALSLSDLESNDSSLVQTVRAFSSEEEASEFLQDLRASLESCPSYTLGAGVDQYASDVTVYEPELAVTSIGWHETGSDYDFTCVDMQRGNLVVRTWYSRPTDPASTQAFDAVMEELGQKMAALVPR